MHQLFQNTEFGGERPLYGLSDARLENVTIHVGESSVKECRNIEATNCRFEGKYVFWENHNLSIRQCYFAPSTRSSIWYSRRCHMSDCEVDTPKMFRRVQGLEVERTTFSDGQEMLWDCRTVRLQDVRIANCDYIFMHSRDIVIDRYHQDGNYGFQQAHNVEIHNAVINSKDAFWEAENVTIYDSEINGEYLGWYAHNMRLVRCHLTGEQLLCYVDGLILEDCTFGEDANLLFEYSTVRGSIRGNVTSIKNPRSWDVTIDGTVGEWIEDANKSLGYRQWNLSEPINRRGTDCVKWDEDPTVQPLWVADMDFPVAPAIARIMRERTMHEVYGYVRVPETYYESVQRWFARRHGWTIARCCMLYTPGVVPAISAILQAMVAPGSRVLLLTPVYNCFYSSIRNSGCVADEVPLLYQNHRYEIDWQTLEQHAADPATQTLLLCNPHNPAGRVWSRGELIRIADICLAHGVFVISDEIHCELTLPGIDYTPFGTLGEQYQATAAICTSASKAFNIAGLQMSNVVVADADTRSRIDKQININEVCDVNPFGHLATVAAYDQSEAWLDDLRQYIADNYAATSAYIAEHLPMVGVTQLEGTYLMWLDVRALTSDSEAFAERLKREAGVWLAAGVHYGAAGEGFLRINLACPQSELILALEKFSRMCQSLL